MLRKLAIVLAIVIVVFLIVVAMQPDDYRISRSKTIAAPPAAAFAQANDFHNWAAWSAWDKIDPNMKRTYEGSPSGVGAVYKWSGNDEIGEGKMTITESKPNELVRVKLEFFKPMEGQAMADMTFKSEGAGTLATWEMYGKNNFLGKAFHLCIDMDKMIGGKYDESLTALKSVVETGTKPVDTTKPTPSATAK